MLKTLEERIELARKIHGNKYDYTKSIECNCKDKIIVTCPIHGDFITTWDGHINNKYNCPKCQKCHKWNNEEWINEVSKKHNNKYDYSKTIYTKAKEKVTVICHEKDENGIEHGEFQIRAGNHMAGIGCPKCSGKMKLTNETFIEKAIQVHGDKYDYSKVEYVNSQTKVCIICPKHGKFYQVPSSHLNGCGCPKCVDISVYDKETFIKKANEKHNNKYTYDNFIYVNIKTPSYITCPEHGDFLQIPELHLKGYGCKKCSGQINNKEFGYWNDYERCKNETLKYNNKSQLQKNSCGAFNAIKRNGWEELFDIYKERREICFHNYNEPIHCVYVYEFKEYNTCYIGRTLRLKVRHRQHKNGITHSNGQKEYDNLYKFCEKHNIKMDFPLVIEDNLKGEESLEREDYWIKEYKKNGWNLINTAPTGIGVGSLGTGLKWTYNACLEESKKYKSKTEFEKGCQSAYKAAVRYDWINDFFENKKKPDGYWDNIENCKIVALECKNYKELSLKYGAAYKSIKENKWQEHIKFKN